MPTKPKKRRRNNEVPQASQSGQPTSEDEDNDDCAECIKEESLEETNSSSRPSSGDGISSRDEKTTRRNLFAKQATCQRTASGILDLNWI